MRYEDEGGEGELSLIVGWVLGDVLCSPVTTNLGILFLMVNSAQPGGPAWSRAGPGQSRFLSQSDPARHRQGCYQPAAWVSPGNTRGGTFQ